MQRLLVDQLEPAQLVDLGAHAVAGLGDARQQAQRELAADHRGDLDRAPRFLGEPIDARDQDVLHRVGHGRSSTSRAPARCGRSRVAARRPRAATWPAPRRRTGCPRPCGDQRAQRRPASVGACRASSRSWPPCRRPTAAPASRARDSCGRANGCAVAGAVREHEQDARGRDHVGDEGEALLRRRIDPVQVLDHDAPAARRSAARSVRARRARNSSLRRLAESSARTASSPTAATAACLHERQRPAEIGAQPIDSVASILARGAGLVVAVVDARRSGAARR